MEKWKKIKDWPYKISSNGRIKSLPRYVNAYLRRGTLVELCKKRLKSKHRKPVLHKNGYLQIMLKNNGKFKMFSVHRLVLETFSPDFTGKDVNHKNLIKHDNRLENLEWATKSENMKHAVINGRMHTDKHMARYKKLIGNKYASKNKGN